MSRQFILYRKIVMMRLLCCLALLAAFVMPAAADIDINGKFKTPPMTPSGYQQISGAGIPSWTVTSGNVDWISNFWGPPTGGGYSVDLNGTGPGEIASTVHLLPGKYLLSFYLAGYAAQGNPIETVGVSAGDVADGTVNSAFSVTAVETGRDLRWTHETFAFSVEKGKGSNTIAFWSRDAKGPDGPVVGNVSVTRVPEAGFYSAFALNLGGLLLGGGLLLVRRRRKA